MLTNIHPKLPMRDKFLTKEFYTNHLDFNLMAEYDEYLMVAKDNVEIHFFTFKELDPTVNYGQIYIRTNEIDKLYEAFKERKISIHPNGQLELKPWGQKEFSLLDPDNNLITFGQSLSQK